MISSVYKYTERPIQNLVVIVPIEEQNGDEKRNDNSSIVFTDGNTQQSRNASLIDEDISPISIVDPLPRRKIVKPKRFQ